MAKTLLQRSGARLDLRNRESPQTGAVVEVVWPREVLDAGLTVQESTATRAP